jgi:hypothetical protein
MLILVVSIISISALNAKIGNGRMILRGKVGDTLDKTIKVINDNSFPVRMELIAAGDMNESIKVIDNNFTLAAQEEKDARIQIKILNEGQQNGSVVIKFIPANIEDGKNGVALSSTIIVFGENNPDYVDDTTDDTTDDTSDDTTDDTTDDTGGVKNPIKISPILILLSITAIIFVVLIVLLVIYSNKKVYSEENLVQKPVMETKLKKKRKKNE